MTQKSEDEMQHMSSKRRAKRKTEGTENTPNAKKQKRAPILVGLDRDSASPMMLPTPLPSAKITGSSTDTRPFTNGAVQDEEGAVTDDRLLSGVAEAADADEDEPNELALTPEPSLPCPPSPAQSTFTASVEEEPTTKQSHKEITGRAQVTSTAHSSPLSSVGTADALGQDDGPTSEATSSLPHNVNVSERRLQRYISGLDHEEHSPNEAQLRAMCTRRSNSEDFHNPDHDVAAYGAIAPSNEHARDTTDGDGTVYSQYFTGPQVQAKNAKDIEVQPSAGIEKPKSEQQPRKPRLSVDKQVMLTGFENMPVLANPSTRKHTRNIAAEEAKASTIQTRSRGKGKRA